MNHTFFGFQIAIQAPSGDPLRARLRDLVIENQSDQTIIDQRGFYTRLANLLNQAEKRYALGYWDYIPGAEADREFDEWVSELEALAAEDAPAGPAAGAGDHVVVSVVFLLQAGSNSDQTVGERCDLPEDQFFARQTFVRLVATLRMLSFATVQADAVYLVPGAVEAGITLDELKGPGFEYLRPLV